MNLRIQFEYDTDPDFSYLGQWDTPETYAGNEALKDDGTPATFEEYMAYWGNVDRHIALIATVESQCECCDSWVSQISLGGIDFMDDDAYEIGTFTKEEAADLKGYCKDVAAELFAETEENLK
jgi:hypothetical protein